MPISKHGTHTKDRSITVRSSLEVTEKFNKNTYFVSITANKDLIFSGWTHRKKFYIGWVDDDLQRATSKRSSVELQQNARLHSPQQYGFSGLHVELK